MKTGDVITADGRRYEVVEMLPVGGKSQPAKVLLDGVPHFLKRINSPVYPQERGGYTEEKYRAKLRLADNFEARHRAIMDLLEHPIVGGGNLVKPTHLFRHKGNFIKVYPYVKSDSCRVMHEAPPEDQLIFVKTLLLCVRELHAHHIVHSDLKPDNVLVEELKVRVAKLIDFDEAYLAGQPPPPRRMSGDFVYFSPEQYEYWNERLDPDQLTTQSDIFSLGIVIFSIVAGEFPRFKGGEGDSPAERLTSGGTMTSYDMPGFPPAFSTLVRRTLAADPRARPTIEELLDAVGVAIPPRDPAVPIVVIPGSPPSPPPSGGSRVTSSMGRRSDRASTTAAPSATPSPSGGPSDGIGVDTTSSSDRPRIQKNFGRRSKGGS